MGMNKVWNILAALCLVTAIFCLTVVVVTAQPFIYRQQLHHLPDPHELGKRIIQENYQSMVRYCLDPRTDTLTFQGLTQSPQGISHFQDVRQIFQHIVKLGALSLVLGVPLMIHRLRQKQYGFLLLAGGVILLLMVFLAAAILGDFERSFRIFHETFFTNDYWLFQPDRDPIILYLPADFFQKMALIMAGMLVSLALIFLCWGLWLKKNPTRQAGSGESPERSEP